MSQITQGARTRCEDLFMQATQSGVALRSEMVMSIDHCALVAVKDLARARAVPGLQAAKS